MTTSEKAKWVEDKLGIDWVHDESEKGIDFCYAMVKDYGVCSGFDLDGIAWLNTLIGYDIGAERALAMMARYYDETENIVLEFNAGDKALVQHLATECGFSIDFSHWATETPDVISYDWWKAST